MFRLGEVHGKMRQNMEFRQYFGIFVCPVQILTFIMPFPNISPWRNERPKKAGLGVTRVTSAAAVG